MPPSARLGAAEMQPEGFRKLCQGRTDMTNVRGTAI